MKASSLALLFAATALAQTSLPSCAVSTPFIADHLISFQDTNEHPRSNLVWLNILVGAPSLAAIASILLASARATTFCPVSRAV